MRKNIFSSFRGKKDYSDTSNVGFDEHFISCCSAPCHGNFRSPFFVKPFKPFLTPFLACRSKNRDPHLATQSDKKQKSPLRASFHLNILKRARRRLGDDEDERGLCSCSHSLNYFKRKKKQFPLGCIVIQCCGPVMSPL